MLVWTSLWGRGFDPAKGYANLFIVMLGLFSTKKERPTRCSVQPYNFNGEANRENTVK